MRNCVETENSVHGAVEVTLLVLSVISVVLSAVSLILEIVNDRRERAMEDDIFGDYDDFDFDDDDIYDDDETAF